MSRLIASVVGKLCTMIGYDGADFRNVLVNDAGRLQVDGVTMAAPEGLATEETLATLATDAKLETVWVLLNSINNKDLATQTTLAEMLVELALKANLTETQPVSLTSTPLPSGASTDDSVVAVSTRIGTIVEPVEGTVNAQLATLATDAKLETVWALLNSINNKELATEGTIAEIQARIGAKANPVTGSANWQLAELRTELAGKADLDETQPVSNASLPLPTGAATSANQTSLKTEVDKLTDLRYQGDHFASDLGAPVVHTSTLTNIVDYTVPANKVFYLSSWFAGISEKDLCYTVQLWVGGVQIAELATINAPLGLCGVCFGKCAAAGHVQIKGWQASGVDKNMSGFITGFLEDA